MNILFIGDSHGDWPRRNGWPVGMDLAIHVGDFGIWPGYEERWSQRRPSYPVWFVEGNHEHYPSFAGDLAQWPGLTWKRRGTVEVVDGLRIGFCGGGDSIDKHLRRQGINWWENEKVEVVDFGTKLDVLITHQPSAEVARAMFGPVPMNPLMYYRQPSPMGSAEAVSTMLKQTEPKLAVSGHLHKSFKLGVERVLDVNEFFILDTQEIKR